MKRKVLIIEDDWDLACLMTLRLGGAGFMVEAAPDGELGLYRVQTFTPDVVLLDLLIPRLDGWEVCRRLKKSNQTKDIPIVACTALRETGLQETLASVGIKAIVNKPLDTTTLLAAVNRVLA